MKKLFSIELMNPKTKSTLVAAFFEPSRNRRYIKEHKVWAVSWITPYVFYRDGEVIESSFSTNVSWLSSLLLAVSAFQKLIPAKEEKLWVDASGVQSWVLMPRALEISWGYDLFKALAKSTTLEKKRYISQIGKKRKK